MSPPVAWIPMDTESLKSGFSEVSNRSRRTAVSLTGVTVVSTGNNHSHHNGFSGAVTGGSVVSLSLPSRHHHKNHRSHRYGLNNNQKWGKEMFLAKSIRLWVYVTYEMEEFNKVGKRAVA